MKVYLASPFFNEREKRIYNFIIRSIRKQEGIDLFVPQEHTIPNAWDLPNHLWAESVFAVDLLALQQCDVVVVINYGMYSDSGTAWECGYAYATGKKIINVLVDTHTNEENCYSLMMLNGGHYSVPLRYFGVTPLSDILEHKMTYVKHCEQKQGEHLFAFLLFRRQTSKQNIKKVLTNSLSCDIIILQTKEVSLCILWH